MTCQCDKPFIKCDHLGCRCMQCGQPERVDGGLQAARQSADLRLRPIVTVKGGDYEYAGTLVSHFHKLRGGIRYVVEDANGRLFIHNAKQLGKEEGWVP